MLDSTLPALKDPWKKVQTAQIAYFSYLFPMHLWNKTFQYRNHPAKVRKVKEPTFLKRGQILVAYMNFHSGFETRLLLLAFSENCAAEKNVAMSQKSRLLSFQKLKWLTTRQGKRQLVTLSHKSRRNGKVNKHSWIGTILYHLTLQETKPIIKLQRCKEWKALIAPVRSGTLVAILVFYYLGWHAFLSSEKMILQHMGSLNLQLWYTELLSGR